VTLWPTVLGALGGLLLLWVVLVGLLLMVARRHVERMSLRDAVRLVPDLVRLIRSLAADPQTPRGARLLLLGLLGYLASPIDLVPDFIPILGHADDVVVMALALRSVIRQAGPETLERHWAGTDSGLRVIRRLAAVPG
jgi:uncharacterized membrane protein YkvA (DUF1232 family)